MRFDAWAGSHPYGNHAGVYLGSLSLQVSWNLLRGSGTAEAGPGDAYPSGTLILLRLAPICTGAEQYDIYARPPWPRQTRLSKVAVTGEPEEEGTQRKG